MESVEAIAQLRTEDLIGDLALILVFGALSIVLFKKLKQPLVLGYIVAGFLVGPHFLYVPSVTSEPNIEFWGEIGIVVLLFALGLEFSFKKLMNVGGSAVIASLTCVTGMLLTGMGVGKMLHFSFINSLFLGAMLSMSSTTIIIKAISDLNLKRRKFVPLVSGMLVCEDLFAVVMMVILSSIAVKNSFEGSELALSVAKLVLFLVLSFAVGVYVIPSLFRYFRRTINDEVLLIIAMGLCFAMSIIAVKAGFSLALGAFLMGSILAGTCEAERIEHVVKPVKDLFGAVFFISVGMMVDPVLIWEYIGPIMLISACVIVGMIFFGTLGMLVAGQPLKIAIESGFCLPQIGEFAFIIATLGMNLGVLDATIYPIIVAVSVITTFFTPYFIKFAEPVYNWLLPRLPEKLHFLITRYSSQAASQTGAFEHWKRLLARYAWRMVMYSIIIIGIAFVAREFFIPEMENIWGTAGKVIAAIASIAVLSPFLLALSIPPSNTENKYKGNNILEGVPFVVLSIIRVLLAVGLTVWFISSIFNIAWGFAIGISLVVLFLAFISGRIRSSLTNIEAKFYSNLNVRELRKSGKDNNLVSDMHVAYMTVGSDCPIAGEKLGTTNLRKDFGVNIVSIQRGYHVIPIPTSDMRLFPGDQIGVVGNDADIERTIPFIEKGADNDEMSPDKQDVMLQCIEVGAESPLAGHSTRSLELRNKYSALLVAIQRGANEYIKPTGDEIFEVGDKLWVVGDVNRLSELK